MLIPMLKQLLEQGLLEGPKRAIEDAKTRIIFAVLGLIVGIVALTFIFYAAFLWLSVPYGRCRLRRSSPSCWSCWPAAASPSSVGQVIIRSTYRRPRRRPKLKRCWPSSN